MLGVLAARTRIGVHAPVVTDDCTHGWRMIEPRGFVCAKVEATKADASHDYFPRVPKGALVPGTYGKIRSEGARIYADAAAVKAKIGTSPSAALTVRRLGTVAVDGREYWRTRHGPSRSRTSASSTARLPRLEIDDALASPRVWARFRGNDGKIPLYSAHVRARRSKVD